MNYKFHYTFINDCEEASRTEDDFNVELTAEEVNRIRRTIDPFSKVPVEEQMRRHLKKIYRKIIDAGYPMCQYVCLRSIRQLDMGNDIAWEQVDYDALLQEDIEKNGFVPHDAEGHPYIKEEMLRQWVKWEDQMLSQRNYPERIKYIEDRYHFSVADVLDLKNCHLSFTLPQEIDINCPTDGWIRRKIGALKNIF